MPEMPPELFDRAVSFLMNAAGAIALLLFVWVASAWARRTIVSGLEKRGFDATLTKFFGNLVRWMVLLLGALSALSLFGIQTTSFAAVLGGAGLAIGLAFSGTLGNFAAGLLLLTFRPFRVGDVVTVAGTTGKVNEIELFTTTLDTPDNRRLILPNSKITGTTIENVTFHDERRVDVAVGTEYSADVDRTREVLEEATRRVPGLLDGRTSQVVLVELGASSVDWSVRVWGRTADYLAVRQACTREVKLALDAAGIGIPFPQMDVHLDPPVAAGR